ncbi:hypothetical protein OKW41_004382 [Paraburkholderia sp. UCT70]
MSRPKAQALAQCLELDTRIGEFWHPAFQEGAEFLHLRRFVGIFRSDEVIRVTTSNGGLNGSTSCRSSIALAQSARSPVEIPCPAAATAIPCSSMLKTWPRVMSTLARGRECEFADAGSSIASVDPRSFCSARASAPRVGRACRPAASHRRRCARGPRERRGHHDALRTDRHRGKASSGKRRAHADCALFTTVPGIGQTLATVIVLETGTRHLRVGSQLGRNQVSPNLCRGIEVKIWNERN